MTDKETYRIEQGNNGRRYVWNAVEMKWDRPTVELFPFKRTDNEMVGIPGCRGFSRGWADPAKASTSNELLAVKCELVPFAARAMNPSLYFGTTLLKCTLVVMTFSWAHLRFTNYVLRKGT